MLSFIIKTISFTLLAIGIFIIIYNKFNIIESKNTNIKRVEAYYNHTNNISEYDSLIEIPSINIKTIVYNGNKSMSIVNKGVSFMYKTNIPSSNELVVLVGHSGNGDVSYFKNIDKLESKDLIVIHYKYKKYNYFVTNSYIVDQYDTDIVNKKVSNGIMLITCLPGNNKKRLVVEGIKEESIY